MGAALVVVALGAVLTAAAAGGTEAQCDLPFLGEAHLPRGSSVDGTRVGGLSAIAYDPGRGVYYALSDDRSDHAPARFYTLSIDLADGRLASDGVVLAGVTTLLDEDGEPFAAGGVDPEGIALASRDTLFVSSEGDSRKGIAPFVREVGLDGSHRRSFALPPAYLPGPAGGRGVRSNLGLEGLTLAPDGGALFTATENALAQDGPEAAVGRRSPSRLLRLDPETGRPADEFLYLTDPVAAAPLVPGALAVAGLVELLALPDGALLALERSFSAGVGNSIRLYRVSLAGADSIAGRERLDLAADPVQPVAKELLCDLAALDVALDNLEGMTLGPLLADGRRTLVLVSDDNFNPLQATQFLAFALAE